MDLQPYQTPPRWWSPQLSPAAFHFWKWIRRRIRVEHHRLLEIEIRGLDNLRRCIDEKQGILITPNHSCHADPTVMYWVADQLNMPFYFMATWQIFQRANWRRRMVLRQHGCFSVDRDGTDIRAFKQAVEILEDKPYPLVIFPEGEIYHINKHITPFRDGPAAIALRARKHDKRPISVVPCGIRYQYLSDPTPELTELMSRLEERILWRPKPQLNLQERMFQFAGAILGLKEQEYLGKAQSGTLPERIKALMEFILSGLERKYGVGNRGIAFPERIKACRRHAISLAEDTSLTEEEHNAALIDLDDLFIATQLFSYPGNVSSGESTIEELAETMDKFEEDVLRASSASIRGTRRAIVAFGDAIPVETHKGDRNQTHALTEQVEQAVQALLESNEPT